MLKADALVLDLEDSVTPDNKDSARTTRVVAICGGGGGLDMAAAFASRAQTFAIPVA